MPLQNRVTPFGEIITHPARGTFTGNRGCLCDEPGELARRRWRLKAWITCQLSYKGWWRPVMQPGVWTELFFLDEATALAAGHRPCALCRREDYDRYRKAWMLAARLNSPLRATEMDGLLHQERTNRDRGKVTFRARLSDLPAETMVIAPAPGSTRAAKRAALIHEARLLEWSPGGYTRSSALKDAEVEVLTPKSSVMVLAAGYNPLIHESADGLLI